MFKVRLNIIKYFWYVVYDYELCKLFYNMIFLMNIYCCWNVNYRFILLYVKFVNNIELVEIDLMILYVD